MYSLFQINSTCNQGATGRIVEQIGLLAEARGWKAITAHGARYVQPSYLESYQICSIFDEKRHFLNSLLFDGQGLSCSNATLALTKRIEKANPSIVHLHNIHGYYINYKILFEYLNRKKIPVVWTLHDCWAFTGHCTYFDMIRCEKWQIGCSDCPQTKEYPKSIIDKSKRNWKLKKELFSNHPNLILVPVSNWLADKCKFSFFNNRASIVPIHNGIDLDVFKKDEEGSKDIKRKYGINGKMVIAVANGFGKRKGLEDIFILRKLLAKDIAIVLVGVSKSERERAGNDFVAIEHTENINELIALYSAADVFINPTHEDNYPTTNLEAMACGTPVITYKTGGSPEAVDINTGIVVDVGDVQGLHDAILTVLSSSVKYNKHYCRERAERSFDKNKCFEAYIKLYEEILLKS